MNFKTHNDAAIHTLGTHLQGVISMPYSKIVKVFGEPRIWDEEKVDAYWEIVFEDGTPATIYNYKDGKNYNGKDGLETDDITEWHIGGFGRKSVLLVQQSLGVD